MVPFFQLNIRKELMPDEWKHKALLVWVRDLQMAKKAIEVFDGTVMRCAQKIDPGIYNLQTR